MKVGGFSKKISAVFLTLSIILVQLPLISSANDYSTVISTRLQNTITLCLNTPKVYVKNVETRIDPSNPNITPISVNGQTLIPVRFVSEIMNSTVRWNGNTSTATIGCENNLASIKVNSKFLNLNGQDIHLDVPAKIINGRLYLPLRVFVEKIINKKLLFYDGVIIISDNEHLFDVTTEKSMLQQIKFLFYETIYDTRVICNNSLKLSVPSILEETTNLASINGVYNDKRYQSKSSGSLIQILHSDIHITNDEIRKYKNQIINSTISAFTKKEELTKWLDTSLYNVKGNNIIKIDGIINNNENQACFYSQLYFSVNNKEYYIQFFCTGENYDLWKNAPNIIMNSIRIGVFNPTNPPQSIIPPILIPATTDGGASNHTQIPTPTPSQKINGITLNFKPVDAEMDSQNSIMYLTDKVNKKLYSVNCKTEDIKSISFDMMPEQLLIKDRELFVTLISKEHSSYSYTPGAIAVIDLDTFSQKEKINIDLDPYDIAVGNDNNLYVTSGSDQWTDIKSYSRSTKSEIGSSGIRQESFAIMHPILNRIYTIDTDSSPRDYTAYNITNGKFADANYPGGYDSPYHGDYPLSINFKISPDGKYLFNGSGVIFSIDENKTNDMKYYNKLDNSFSDIEFQLSKKKFYIGNKHSLITYDYSTLQPTNTEIVKGNITKIFVAEDKIKLLSTDDDGKYFIESVDSAP